MGCLLSSDHSSQEYLTIPLKNADKCPSTCFCWYLLSGGKHEHLAEVERLEFPPYSALPLITRFTQRARKNTGQRNTDAPPAANIMPQIGPF